tara:strand:- start:1003 stop:1176 length:174 start_codon:yes stop_codon:yes gene_type:complete
MNKSSIIIFIYILGIIIGAIFLDIWSAETNIIKALIGVGWTALFAISLFFVEKKNNE